MSTTTYVYVTTTIPYSQWMLSSTPPLCHFWLLADQPPPEASQQRRDLVRLSPNTLVPPLFHHHPPWAENSYNLSILGWPTFSLATVGLLEALVLDFVVEDALICWLWSVLDCFSLITSPLSMAYSKRSQLLKVLKKFWNNTWIPAVDLCCILCAGNTSPIDFLFFNTTQESRSSLTW